MLSAKAASLLAGVFQQAALVLIIRYSKTRHQQEQDQLHVAYLTSVAVMSAEVFKLCLSYVLEVITTSSSTNTSTHGTSSSSDVSKSNTTSTSSAGGSTLKRMLSLNRESIKLIIPAALYLLQNNLLFVALSHLSVPTYQISNQGKLLTTAIISRVLLKKRITTMQYCAIALLGLGVAIVQLSEHHINLSGNQSKADSSSGTVLGGQQNQQWLGLLAVLVSCFTSGFAGVYFEFVLKTTKQSVHCRNFQLAFWSFLFAIIHIVSTDMSQAKSHGLFHGFDGIVMLVVVAQAMSGFVVSMMLKYADALLKGFAVSVAVIVASVASIFLFDTKIDGMFFVGASMVGIAVKMYYYYGAGKESLKTENPLSRTSGEKVSSYGSWKKRLIYFIPIFFAANAAYTHSIIIGEHLLGEDTIQEMSEQAVQAKLPRTTLRTESILQQDPEETLDKKVTKDEQPGANLNSAEELHVIQSYQQRDISNYTVGAAGYIHNSTSVPRGFNDANCLAFRCNNNVTKCDTTLPTDYDGREQPCCVHVLRDMSRVFDDEMHRLGLEYMAAFGTLLGLRRSDRLIPWTGDNDYIIPSEDVANAMVALWDTNSTGLAHILQGINRMCLTPDFAGGKLQRWIRHRKPPKSLATSGLPYIDFYVGQNNTQDMFSEFRRCKHAYSDVFPSQRVLVYNKTFAQNIPANTDQLLRTYYGLDWREPSGRRRPHGPGPCPNSPFLK